MSEQPSHVYCPIQTFTHQKNDSRIDLVGMIHVAESQFYQGIQQYIDDRVRAGASVHYEGCRLSKPAELAAASRYLRVKSKLLALMMKNTSGLLDGMGLEKQSKALNYRDEWENHDTNDLELAKRLKLSTLLGKVALVQILKRQPLRVRQRTAYGVLSDSQTTETDLPEDDALVVFRNAIALEAIRLQLAKKAESNLVLLWGEGHLPGIGQGLEDLGYALTGRERRIAIHAATFNVL